MRFSIASPAFVLFLMLPLLFNVLAASTSITTGQKYIIDWNDGRYCGNEGVEIPLMDGTSICRCVDGIIRPSCRVTATQNSHVRNVCSSSPCLNGGTCLIQNNSTYFCQCPKHYHGYDCQHPIDYCYPNPCHNHAVCARRNADDDINYECRCIPYTFGDRCEFVSPCAIECPDGTCVSYYNPSIARMVYRCDKYLSPDEHKPTVWFLSIIQLVIFVTPLGIVLYFFSKFKKNF